MSREIGTLNGRTEGLNWNGKHLPMLNKAYKVIRPIALDWDTNPDALWRPADWKSAEEYKASKQAPKKDEGGQDMDVDFPF